MSGRRDIYTYIGEECLHGKPNSCKFWWVDNRSADMVGAEWGPDTLLNVGWRFGVKSVGALPAASGQRE